jgi:hypothetical protein
MKLRDVLCAALQAAFAAAALLAAGACAAQDPPSSQDLYLDAMKSISEGRQGDADDALTRLIEQEPQHAGAWLDLAIIQCELGHAAEAERLFAIIESRFSPPPGIEEVIAMHRLKGCKDTRQHNKLSVLLGRGFDTNVNQGSSSPFFSLGDELSPTILKLTSEYLPQHDQYTLLSTQFVHDLGANGGALYLQAQARENDTLSKYNTVSLLNGVDYPYRLAGWQTRTTATAGVLGLGGELYQRQYQLEERVFPPLGLRENLQFNLLAGVSYVQYPTLDNFNAATDELGTQLSYQNNRTQVQTGLNYLFDHGDARYLGGDRHGWLATASVEHRINDRLSAQAGWLWQDWRGDTEYSPGLIDQVRRENTQVFRLGLTIAVKSNAAVQVEWRQVRNNENISLFEYSGRLLQVSLKWQNF